MNKLFVPFDFSDIARNALAYAVGLAKSFNASITLFHAFEVPVPAGYEDASLTFSMALANGEKEKLQHRLQEATEAFKDSGVAFQIEIRRAGLEEGAQDFLAQNPHNLIVMGTRGLQGWEESIDETNTVMVSEAVSTSILVVPAKATFKGLRHTIYGGNFDFKDSVILDDLNSFMSFFGGHITYLHVRTKPDPANADFEKMERLEKLFIDTPEAEVKFEVVASNTVEQALFAYAKDYNADMIVVTPQDHGVIGGLFHKSITRQLAHHTDMPLLIIKK